MLQGFYNLASGMATQNRNMEVISNNMTNMSTPGYKVDQMTATTFQQEMFYRTGNQGTNNSVQLGNVNMIKIPQETITDFSDGSFSPTGGTLDFAISGDGFFKIAMGDGTFSYTRNGSFFIDADSCLALKGYGKVQGTAGDIFLDSDSILADGIGGIYTKEGESIDNLEIVNFEEKTGVEWIGNGLFRTNQAEVAVEEPSVMNQMLELSNANPMQEMQKMIATQRSFQSASQMLKIYDQIMGKATTEIARF